MSTRQLSRRLAKVQAKVSPEHGGGFTLEELLRSLWEGDEQKYREMANGPDGYGLRHFMAQFEREDAERAARARQ